MFTATGNGVIPQGEKVVERAGPYGVFLNFALWVKDPYKQGRKLVNVALLVPTDYLQEARTKVVPGAIIQVRIGELAGIRTKSGGVYMTVNTKWKWIEILKAMPTGERKEYQDI